MTADNLCSTQLRRDFRPVHSEKSVTDESAGKLAGDGVVMKQSLFVENGPTDYRERQ